MEKVYSDGLKSKKEILKNIQKAKGDINIAMAYFTDTDIANKLIEKANSGVNVNSIISEDEINIDIINLLGKHSNVIIAPKAGRGIMHHKFCIIDNQTLIHGSYNYTFNAAKNNSESLNITDSYSLIKDYKKIFDDMSEEYNNIPTNKKTSVETNDGYLEKFSDELKTHVTQIFDNYNEQEIIELGKLRAEETKGDEGVFTNYLDGVLEDVNTIIHKDDHTKTVVKTRLKSSLDRAIENLNEEFDESYSILEIEKNNKIGHNESEIEIALSRASEQQQEFQELSQASNKVNSDIEDLTDEIENLDRQIKIKKFWTFPTFLKGGFLLILLPYLSFFFASAIWKIFFEKAFVMGLLSRGITPESPPLFDANALGQIFETKGVFFGLVGVIFFIIPVLLTSIKLIVDKNKFIEYFIGWFVGVFVIDIVVSILISQHTFEINRLAIGSDAVWTLNYALTSGEFWLIFIFGSLPLFLTKFIIESLFIAYNWSNPELVDREKFLKRQQLKRKLSEKKLDVSELDSKLNTVREKKESINVKKQNLEEELISINDYYNDKELHIKERTNGKKHNLKEVYNSFLSSVESGSKKFLQNLVGGRITAYKQGFFLFLTSYYAPQENERRQSNLEAIHKNWVSQNFK